MILGKFNNEENPRYKFDTISTDLSCSIDGVIFDLSSGYCIFTPSIVKQYIGLTRNDEVNNGLNVHIGLSNSSYSSLIEEANYLSGFVFTLDDNEEHIIDIENQIISNGNEDNIQITGIDFTQPFYLIIFQEYV